ncbi:MAG TPA: beta-lactamase family protein [Candidatus Ligilactobacillus excrementipullorum]|nr:beta-lactamase family protein [Candidatus Ligilactobacillus excrementipullorum]
MNPKTTNLLHELVSKGIVPGVSYAMIHEGQLQTEVFGAKQTFPTIEKLTPSLLYDVASLTKVVCTTPLILKLVEEHKVGLEQPICQLLPRFSDPRVTVRHLLTHTSAITGYIPNRNQLNADELLTAIYEQLHVGDWLGEKVVYTDIGMILLGQIIEQIYQQPVQQVFAQEILAPLGLSESTFHPDQQECVPTSYDQVRGLIKGEVHDPKAYVLGQHCASAGLFMTLNDVTKDVLWLLGERKPGVLLSEKTINSLFTDWTPNHQGQRSLGFDLLAAPEGHWCLYHTGYTGTFVVVDRVKQDGLAVLTNRVHPRQQNSQFLRARDELLQVYLAEK